MNPNHKSWCPSSQPCNCGAREEGKNPWSEDFNGPDESKGGGHVVIDTSPLGTMRSLLGAFNMDEARPWLEAAITDARQQGREEERERIGKAIYDYFLGLNKVEGEATFADLKAIILRDA